MTKSYLQWIGTGSGLNHTLGNTSFILKGENRTLLVDCGFTVPLELIRSGRLKEITDVVITHTHADHIGGLEGLGFMNYFAYRNRGCSRPKLHLASDSFARTLWENSLKGGMKYNQTEENLPFEAGLETYFDVQIGTRIEISGLPGVKLFPTPHVQNMENYGVCLNNGIWYSGDSIDMPPHDPKIIFQDCQFFETRTDVHVSYDRLRRELPEDVRRKMFLVHLGSGYDKKNPKADGFAGFVKPGDKFEL